MPQAIVYDSPLKDLAKVGGNLSEMFMNAPKYRALEADRANKEAQTQKLRDEMTAKSGVAALFNEATKNPEAFRQKLGEAAQLYAKSGGDISKVGDLYRAMTSMTQGASDQDKMNAGLAAGQNFNENTAFSLPGQNKIAGRNNALAMQKDIAVQAQKPLEVSPGAKVFLPPVSPFRGMADNGVLQGNPTESTIKGETLQGMPDQAKRAVTMSGVTPRNYRTKDGSTGTTLDGYTDAASGDAIPQGASVFSVQAQPTDAGLLTKGDKSGLVMSQAQISQTRNLIAQAKSLASDPTRFGLAGMIKGVAGDVHSQADALVKTFSNPATQEEADMLRNQVMAGLENLGLNEKDPGMAQMEVIKPLLTYNLASVLAGQEGRSAGEGDIKRIQGVVENSNLFGNADDFNTKMDTILKQVDYKQILNQQMLGNGGSNIPTGNLMNGNLMNGIANSPAGSELPSDLPQGLTEADVQHNMQKYGVTREEVIQQYPQYLKRRGGK